MEGGKAHNNITTYKRGISIMIRCRNIQFGHSILYVLVIHDDVIKWKHFPRYWSFVWGIHRSSVNSPHKGQWRGALMFSLICAWINDWVNTRGAGDLRRHRANYYFIVMDIGMLQLLTLSYIPLIISSAVITLNGAFHHSILGSQLSCCETKIQKQLIGNHSVDTFEKIIGIRCSSCFK